MNFIIARPAYFVICFCVLFVSACSVTSYLNLYHPADAEKKSPLSSIPSKTILLQVEDHRPSDSRDLIGYKWNPYSLKNAQGGALKSERPVTDVLYDALLSEFKQNSHEISMSEADGYEMLIKVRLKKFWINNRVIPFSRTELISTIVADIDFIKAQSGDALLTETINTTYRVPFNLNLKSTYQNALNDALKEFVREFSFNSNILEALNNTGSRDTN